MLCTCVLRKDCYSKWSSLKGGNLWLVLNYCTFHFRVVLRVLGASRSQSCWHCKWQHYMHVKAFPMHSTSFEIPDCIFTWLIWVPWEVFQGGLFHSLNTHLPQASVKSRLQPAVTVTWKETAETWGWSSSIFQPGLVEIFSHLRFCIKLHRGQR